MTRKRWIQTGIVIGVLAIGLGLWAGLRSKTAQVTFQTAKVERGDVAAKVTATGTLSALVTVQVGSQVSGRIQEILADFNSMVKKGQVIARIDSQLFKAAVSQAAANLQTAQGNLTKAIAQAEESRRELARQQALFEQKLVSQSELDTIEASARVAEASIVAARGAVMQARASHDQAKVNLTYTNIVSPIDGIVISRSIDVGQTVAAAFQAPTLFTIAEDLTRMQVDTNVSEADIGKLAPEMEASFTVDAFPRMVFRGKIRQIRHAPITVQNVVTYDAVIDVENPELKLKPGMTANVTIAYAKAENTLKVPNSALRYRPATPATPAPQASPTPEAGQGQGGRKRVAAPSAERTVYRLVPPSEKPEPLTITVGISDGTHTEVTGGELTEGMLVITGSDEARPAQTPGGPGPGGRRLF